MPSMGFDRCALRVDQIINQECGSINGSSKYEQKKGLKAVTKIETELGIIKQQMTLPSFLHSPLDYKTQALEALCTIALLVISTKDDIVAGEIRRAFQHDNDIPNLMSATLKSLSSADLQSLRGASVLSDLGILIKNARAYGIEAYDRLAELVPEAVSADHVLENTPQDVAHDASHTRFGIFQRAMQQLFDDSVFSNGAAYMAPLVTAVNERLPSGSVLFTGDEALQILEELNERDIIMLSGDIVYRLEGTTT
jgi:hypothetical protein